MIAHVVLFRPRPDLTPDARSALLEAFEAARRDIPSIRAVRVGKRITHGRPYEALMAIDYQYAAVLEFDDLSGLQAYLAHPAHERLAALFFSAFEHALMYDFQWADGAALLPE